MSLSRSRIFWAVVSRIIVRIISPCVLVSVYNRLVWARQTVFSLAPLQVEAAGKPWVVAPFYKLPAEPEQLPGPESLFPSPHPQGWASAPVVVGKEMRLERHREGPRRHRRLQGPPGRGHAPERRDFRRYQRRGRHPDARREAPPRSSGSYPGGP